MIKKPKKQIRPFFPHLTNSRRVRITTEYIEVFIDHIGLAMVWNKPRLMLDGELCVYPKETEPTNEETKERLEEMLWKKESNFAFFELLEEISKVEKKEDGSKITYTALVSDGYCVLHTRHIDSEELQILEKHLEKDKKAREGRGQ